MTCYYAVENVILVLVPGPGLPWTLLISRHEKMLAVFIEERDETRRDEMRVWREFRMNSLLRHADATGTNRTKIWITLITICFIDYCETAFMLTCIALTRILWYYLTLSRYFVCFFFFSFPLLSRDFRRNQNITIFTIIFLNR